MRRIAPHLLVAALLLPAGAARADRFERAENNFKTNCIGCHTLGWAANPPNERGKVDLTLAAARLDERRLRAVLADPASNSAPGCRHQPLERIQVDDLIAYLRLHTAPEVPRQVVPPRSRMRRPSDPPVRPAGRAGEQRGNTGRATTAGSPPSGSGDTSRGNR